MGSSPTAGILRSRFEAFKEYDSMFYAVGMWVVIITLGLALWGIAQVYTDEKPSSGDSAH